MPSSPHQSTIDINDKGHRSRKGVLRFSIRKTFMHYEHGVACTTNISPVVLAVTCICQLCIHVIKFCANALTYQEFRFTFNLRCSRYTVKFDLVIRRALIKRLLLGRASAALKRNGHFSIKGGRVLVHLDDEQNNHKFTKVLFR